MGVRTGNVVQLSIACAMIGSYLSGLEDYFSKNSYLQNWSAISLLSTGLKKSILR